MVSSADDALDEGLIAHLVERGSFGVGVQEYVGVGVYEAGEDREAAEVDVWWGDGGGEGDGAVVSVGN